MKASPTTPAVAAAAGLRPWLLEDAEPLAEMYAAARAGLAMEEPWRTPAYFTAAGQRERIERSAADASLECFVITDAGRIAGALSLAEIKRDILQSADIGYWVDPGRRNRGLATAAIGLAVDHAFSGLGLHRLHATVDLDNLASRRALERNRFQLVGVVKDFAYLGDRWKDHQLYQRIAGPAPHPG